MKSKIKIEKGIPIERVRQARERVYPFTQMVVGDSFLVPKHVKFPYSLAGNASQLYKPWKFTCRKTEDGFRLWRTK